MSRIKEIYCMHHSHLDIGFTHPQPLLLKLQEDYIDQAIDLCVRTAAYPEESRFRWTCEASYPLVRWLRTATAERVGLLRELIQNGQFSVTALPMHTTPGCDAREFVQMLGGLDDLRKTLGAPIRTAVNHDINGQPWPLSQLLLDSGVDFYITGINIHFGGIPFPRPLVFKWQTPDRRELLTFLGEHYSLFSQFFYTCEADTKRMHEGVREYVGRLEENGYRKDYAFLTATNPPLFDNNCPDAELADLIRRYNAEGHEQIIRFVTPEILREKVRKDDAETAPVYRGDWTDYWNFGCASTARETRISRRAKELLKNAELIETRCQSPSARYDLAKAESWNSSILYDEHTWGAAQSVTDPQEEEVVSQSVHKAETAYHAADLAAYVLSAQAELLAGNPHQSVKPEGVLVVNTTSADRQAELNVPEAFTQDGRQLSALRSKQFLPYDAQKGKTAYYGTVSLPPFSYRKIPFSALERNREKLAERGPAYTVEGNLIQTPFYTVRVNRLTGRVEQIADRKRNWPILDETSEWTFFEFVRETVDPRFHPQQRSTIFPRDIALGNRNISVWNHGWKARHEGVSKIVGWEIVPGPDRVTLRWTSQAAGVRALSQEITFFDFSPRIRLKAVLQKEPVGEPEGIYFAFPLNLKENWRCWFDTAGTFVRLDDDQLGKVCRDWVTVDKTVSLCDGEKGVLLACPDAPMVQAGDFNFGKESGSIPRRKNPLLLAWPMNNYWDTNFAADQSGREEFLYELTPLDQFDPVFARRMGELASESTVLGAAVVCDREETASFLKGTGDSVLPLFVKPAGAGTTVALKNFAEERKTYSLEFPGKKIRHAEAVGPQGNHLRALAVADGIVQAELAPQELLLVHAEF